jgi:predicted amidohydrolase YtcJ
MPLFDVFFESFSTAGIVSGLGDDRLRIGPLKIFADGSIGGHTARMRRPYEGEPDNFGLWMMEPDLLLDKIDRAHRAGFQLAIHAIGDAAIELVVQGYEASMAKTPRPDPRHRIEHCGIPDEALLRRIAEIGAVALPGTSFLHFFLDAYEAALGMDRLRYAIGMASFARFGIVAAANTDAPVVSLNPAIGLRCMTTRLDSNDRSVWTEEAISLDDALLAYTANGAYATFEENEKGRLKPGMVGDVAVWETDLHNVEPTALGEVKVDLTVLDGEVVYQRDSARPTNA